MILYHTNRFYFLNKIEAKGEISDLYEQILH